MSDAGDLMRRRFYDGDFETPYIEHADAMRQGMDPRERSNKNREAAWATRDKVKAALEEAFGLTNHPKKEQAWKLAWDERHSSGFFEVIDLYEDFAELMQ